MLVLLSRGLLMASVLLLLVGVLLLVGHRDGGGICTSISHLAWLLGPYHRVLHLIGLALIITGYFSMADAILMRQAVQLASTLGVSLC